MQFRTKHLLILTALSAILFSLIAPILIRGSKTVHQQLCEDLRIIDANKTRIVAYSTIVDSSNAHHTYFLLQSSNEGEHILRHAYHTPNKLWWKKNWFGLNSHTAMGLGYADLSLDESRSFAEKPTQEDIDAFLAPVKTVLQNNSVTFGR